MVELTRRQPEQHKDQQQSGGTAQDLESGQTDQNNAISNVLNQNIKTDVVVI